ncbi:hypothetical protein GCM10010300_52190 [Streptomyces olivaceoviridis]|uniref:phosphotransferase family protein n=1 Tax=Streptomyces olivaceoviridis TaxID=1921 RepID=UPI001677A3DC|nr:phosphotransferase [Streptomyces olivaceoviridis]GGZ01726.1 hypothetical protein GCM10010300_52190 [Streptomyces olivaceoviridis]
MSSRSGQPVGIDEIVPFLIKHGVVSPYDVVVGDLTVAAVSRRNQGFRVTRLDGEGVYVKQPNRTGDGAVGVHDEAAFYGAYGGSDTGISLGLPELLLYDGEVPLLATRLLPRCQTLDQYSTSFPVPLLPVPAFRRLGQCLGEVHTKLTPHTVQGGGAGVPWVFRAVRPDPSALATASPADLSALHILQSSPPISEGIGNLSGEWRTDSVIHGDIRADNVLIEEPSDRSPCLHLIDWELVRPGDARWDLACAVQEVLLLWVGSSVRKASENGMPGSTPLAMYQAAVRAIWTGYLESSHRSARWARATAPHIAQFAAARMVQTALEMTSKAAELSAASVLLMQVSANILAAPDRAAADLLALV